MILLFVFIFAFVYMWIFSVVLLYFLALKCCAYPSVMMPIMCVVGAIACIVKMPHDNRLLPGAPATQDADCSICLEPKTNWMLPCEHMFHERCMLTWVRVGDGKTCPICRVKL